MKRGIKQGTGDGALDPVSRKKRSFDPRAFSTGRDLLLASIGLVLPVLAATAPRLAPDRAEEASAECGKGRHGW